MKKYFDITAIEGRPKPQNDTLLRLVFILVVLGALFIAWDSMNPQKATAKTIEAKDCMTNECVLRIVCGENTNYINVEEICATTK